MISPPEQPRTSLSAQVQKQQHRQWKQCNVDETRTKSNLNILVSLGNFGTHISSFRLPQPARRRALGAKLSFEPERSKHQAGLVVPLL